MSAIKQKYTYATLIVASTLLVFACGKSDSDNQQAALQAETQQIQETSDTSFSLGKSSSITFTDAADIREKGAALGKQAASWQINNLEDFSYIPEKYRERTADPQEWMQGAFYIGLTRFIDLTNSQEFTSHVEQVAESVNYELGKRPLHGDDHAIGQTYLWLSQINGNEQAYAHTQKTFDAILANKPSNSLEFISEGALPGFEGTCQDRWCWADALFMAPRTWYQLANITGNQDYFDYANSEYWATVDYLFSEEFGLFYRDSRYFEMKSDNGQGVFWSRGNGWVFAALPLIIEELPDETPERAKYLTLFTKMANALVKLQREDGYWPASLRDPGKVTTPEVSGTAFITSGIAWGVNSGILTDEASRESAIKGFKAISAAVTPDGRVHYVQQVGKAPDPVNENETQLYGVGAVLLAAGEMARWQSQ